MKRSTLVSLLLTLFYKVILDTSFSFFILPIYGYTIEVARTRGGDPDVSKFIISYFATLFCFSYYQLIIGERHRASRFVMLVQLLIVTIPFFSLYAILDYPTWQMLLVVVGFVLPITIVKLLVMPSVPSLDASARSVMVFVIGLCIVYVYAGLIAVGGLDRLNFDLLKVYIVRAEASKHTFFMSGYLIPWVAYVFNMALLSSFVQKFPSSRIKYGFFAFIVLCFQVFLFGMTNSKAFLFLPFVVIGLMVLLRRESVQTAGLTGVTAACIGVVISYHIYKVPLLAGLMDRVLVIPAALHSLYFDYFSAHPLSLLEATVGDSFGSSYSRGMISVIALEYWGKEFSPNVGWIADAYGNFGALGVFAFSVILAIALRVADGLANKGIAPGVVEGILFGFSFGLTNAALLTSLLTGGFFVALLSLWVMTSSGNTAGRANVPLEQAALPGDA